MVKVLVVLVLFCLVIAPLLAYAFWFAASSFLHDCFGSLLKRESPAGPKDWYLLEQNQLPQADEAEVDRKKEQFSRSLEIHGECIPRTSHYGLISRPLRREE